MILKTIIIDDQKKLSTSLKDTLTNLCPQIDILASTKSPQEGVDLINSFRPDLVFLDINVSVINGFDLIKRVNHNCKVILVSPYDHLTSEISNHLPRPVSIEEITKTINQAFCDEDELKLEHISFQLDNIKAALNKRGNKIKIPCYGYTEIVNIQDIFYLRADLGCVEVHLSNKKIISTLGLPSITKLLGQNFIRSHRSFIVNLDKVIRYYSKNGEIELSNGVKIPVARRRKDDFAMALDYHL